MELVPAKCPICGGELRINPNAKVLTCKFCGCEYMVKEAINNYNTTINNTVINNYAAGSIIANQFDEKTEIQKARTFIDKDKSLAGKTYRKVFEECPNNWEAQYLSIYFDGSNKYRPYEKANALFTYAEHCKYSNDEEQKRIARTFLSLNSIITNKRTFTQMSLLLKTLYCIYTKEEILDEIARSIAAIDFGYDRIQYCESLVKKIDPNEEIDRTKKIKEFCKAYMDNPKHNGLDYYLKKARIFMTLAIVSFAALILLIISTIVNYIGASNNGNYALVVFDIAAFVLLIVFVTIWLKYDKICEQIKKDSK